MISASSRLSVWYPPRTPEARKPSRSYRRIAWRSRPVPRACSRASRRARESNSSSSIRSAIPRRRLSTPRRCSSRARRRRSARRSGTRAADRPRTRPRQSPSASRARWRTSCGDQGVGYERRSIASTAAMSPRPQPADLDRSVGREAARTRRAGRSSRTAFASGRRRYRGSSVRREPVGGREPASIRAAADDGGRGPRGRRGRPPRRSRGSARRRRRRELAPAGRPARASGEAAGAGFPSPAAKTSPRRASSTRPRPRGAGAQRLERPRAGRPAPPSASRGRAPPRSRAHAREGAGADPAATPPISRGRGPRLARPGPETARGPPGPHGRRGGGRRRRPFRHARDSRGGGRRGVEAKKSTDLSLSGTGIDPAAISSPRAPSGSQMRPHVGPRQRAAAAGGPLDERRADLVEVRLEVGQPSFPIALAAIRGRGGPPGRDRRHRGVRP